MTWVTPEPAPGPDPDDKQHVVEDDGQHIVDDEALILDAGHSDVDSHAELDPDADPIPADETPEERERRLAEIVAQEELELLAKLDAEQAARREAAERARFERDRLDLETALAEEVPPLDPLADTNPVQAVDAVDVEDDGEPLPMWRRVVGLALVLLAAVLTFTAGLIVVVPLLRATPNVVPTQAAQVPTATAFPTQTGSQHPLLVVEPTISPAEIAALLAAPPADLNSGETAIERTDSPFTIIPERPRAEVISYTIQTGDTISAIAEQFGLEMDTIAWSNDRETVFALRPGNELYILPVNGAYHRVLVDQTIQSIADAYSVDPYDIINSEFNNLFGATPTTILPSGTRVVVPGGTSTSTDWTYNPVVERTSGNSAGDSSGGNIAFAPGQPGSCGAQANPGGTGYFSAPLARYNWVRGFTSYHTGVDLDAPVGTPVYAASPGRVIYRGWNDWGYGYLIVLAHGPFTTLYGHLSGFNIGCGQMVGAGQVIGYTGNSGNSSGPHLHFEIRYNDIATDPTLYVPF
jgi:murein DD-endopeptidase MepM/ murein hydrolase activator NlpD